uniref:Uncharacterized protein n=1 Tax=Amphora coffeiformis TaxID=265554 RepID=A0A7S3P8M5_9STRA
MTQPISFDGNMMQRMIQPSSLAGIAPIPDTFGYQIDFPSNQPGQLQLHGNFAQATMPFGALGWNDPQLAAFGLATGGGTAASAPSNNIPPPAALAATAAAALPQMETRNRSLNDSPESSSLDSDVEKFLMENFSKEAG